MTMASAPAIHLEGVVKTFPNPLDAARPIRAVDGISLKAGGAKASDRVFHPSFSRVCKCRISSLKMIHANR